MRESHPLPSLSIYAMAFRTSFAIWLALLPCVWRTSTALSKFPKNAVSSDGSDYGQDFGEELSSEHNRTLAEFPQIDHDVERIDPIVYVHVPESGAGWATTIAHHVCKRVIPEDLIVAEPSQFFKSWGSLCNRSLFGRFQSGHSPLAMTDDDEVSHAVVMIRNPIQRILSGYYDDFHDCAVLRERYNCKASELTGKLRCDGDLELENGELVRDANFIPPIEYAKCVENCSANMLTGRYCGQKGEVDVEKAMDAINRMGFVGLTDEWSLSVCLWHRRFGGKALPAELEHMRQGLVTSIAGGVGMYNERALLGSWEPEVEMTVYRAAEERFWSDIERYQIHRIACDAFLQTGTFGSSKLPFHRNTLREINYLHIPQSGSGFATTVAHHTCGADIPKHVSVSEPSDFFRLWGETCNRSRFLRFRSGHDPLHEESDPSTAVVMIRDPVQRVLSAYYNDLHDCWPLRRKYNCRISERTGKYRCDGDMESDDGRNVRDPRTISPVAYGRCVENCSANMLTGKQCSERGHVDVDLAVAKIKQVAFVGLADEWRLSMCLWHKRFGGRVLPVELYQEHRGEMTDVWGGREKYSKSMLGSWRPKSELAVFEAATSRFWKELKEFGITRESCEQDSQDLLGSTGDSSDFEQISPIRYLNLPNSGGRFATTVAHHACGARIPENLFVAEPSDFFHDWSSSCPRSMFRHFQSGHIPLNSNDVEDVDHGVVMIRDPSQRILSGYYNDLHDCWQLRQKYECKTLNGTSKLKCNGDIETEDGRLMRNVRAIPPSEYGQCVENCSANMLTGRGCADEGPADVDHAIEVIDKLGFVGLMDEWALSVCLWHKRFGGRYVPSEFDIPGSFDVNTITGGVVKFDEHALLGHWRPKTDLKVFEAATRRFWRDIERYGVSRQECEQTRSEIVEVQQVEINPILYLHFPESGSGFATTIAHHACGNSIPETVAVLEPYTFFDRWERKCNRSRFHRFRSGHDPLYLEKSEDISHVVMMVREPSQRILAGYFDDLHDCWKLRKKYGCRYSNVTGKLTCDGDNVTEDGTFRNPLVMPPVEYARCVENCTANMLTGRSCGQAGHVNTTAAVKRVAEAGFVGLTDEWAMSVCLWHKRFGGKMLPAEFRRIEPGISFLGATASVSRYDHTSLLGDWVPAADMHVFETASRRFWSDIERYNINRQTCEKEVFNLLVNSLDDSGVDASDETSQVGREINPIYYLHAPESGAGFATVVAHHACGEDIPEDLAVLEPSAFFNRWSGKCDHSRFKRFQSGHSPLFIQETDAGHAVMMFREPSQRVLSGYFNNLHSCYALQRKYNCTASNGSRNSVCDGGIIANDGRSIRDSHVIPPVEYGQCIDNCTTNMLTGRPCSAEGEADVSAALTILDRLGFVGLAEEWTLSVCLWHKKFGGRVLPAELANVRPGGLASAGGGFLEYDENALLGHWRPLADTQIYEAASRRFWAEINKFGVSRVSCELETKMILADAKQIHISEIGQVDITPEMLPAIDKDQGSQLADINPIYYLHVPFSGSGFATTVAHHACAADLPDDVAVIDPDQLAASAIRSCNKSRFMRFRSGHDPLAVREESDVSHVVVMMRDPTQRALSGYFDDFHDCSAMRVKYNCSYASGQNKCNGDIQSEDGRFVRNPRAIPLAEYAKCIENCTANMLTGRPCSSAGRVDVVGAISAVERVGFVGLTDEWAMSVCLWHKRFGGRMLPAELANVRPGSMTIATSGFSKYNDRALLGRWQPAADIAVFEAARARFWREVKMFGITPEDCERQAQQLEQMVPQVKILGEETVDTSTVDEVDQSVFDGINPIYYLHVPESGSGFATTVVRHACGDQLPDTLEVTEPDAFLDASSSFCNESHFSRFKSGHDPLNVTTDADLAHVVVMVRDPSQRVLAGYYNDLHECDALKVKYNCITDNGRFKCDGDTLRDGHFERDVRSISPHEYGRCVENCTANMLTGRRCSEPGTVNISRALSAIKKLGFVGLTDEWTLSVCLWHKMFGGSPVPAEFKNLKPGLMAARSHNFGNYDQHALLGHWRPIADTLVLEATSRRFWSDIQRFGVDPVTCEQEARELIRNATRVSTARLIEERFLS